MSRILSLAVVTALALVACGDREQAFEPVSEKRYQGKPDTPPWGDGERANWEAKLKNRQLTQNEYKRIYER